MATHHLLSLFITLAAFSAASVAGITIDLIHRDSPRSPFFSNSTSHVEKLHAAIQRSNSRAREIIKHVTGANPIPIHADIHSSVGEYLTEISIGTPPKPLLLILDTGSNLLWTQCSPCYECFSQGLPVFDPAQSTSYSPLDCASDKCNLLAPINRQCGSGNKCAYRLKYVDGSFSFGDLATESVYFGVNDPISTEVRGITIGCAHRSRGTFVPDATGVLGLGQSSLSFLSQTKLNRDFGGKFAYCLIPASQGGAVSSKLNFGNDAVVSGFEAVSLALLASETTYYATTLNSVSVEPAWPPPKRARARARLEEANGQVEPLKFIIDSGATITYLSKEMFDGLVADLKARVNVGTVEDTSGRLKLCFKGAVELPTVVLHFEGLVDMALATNGTFLRMGSDVSCLVMLPSPSAKWGILGNVAQQGFLVGYDIVAKTVTFMPYDCNSYVLRTRSK